LRFAPDQVTSHKSKKKAITPNVLAQAEHRVSDGRHLRALCASVAFERLSTVVYCRCACRFRAF
jgi:hypothetical protein